jgi:threonylcarbamoyladenosine tRNA methylthiotransferase MtaB
LLSIENSSAQNTRKSIRSRIAFHTLGCKLNFSETSSISRKFDFNKYKQVDFSEIADVYVINTCSVTENADKRFRVLVNKALKLNQKAFVAAIGCYAQLQPEELISIQGVDLVLGANEKFNLPNYLNDLTKTENGKIHSCEIEDVSNYVGSYSLNDRTRSFLKVQDGCDYKCTYCTIPKARGVSRSESLSNIILNAKKIASNGINEIVLTGVNIGDYGKGEYGNKKHEHTFLDLIKKLEDVTSVKRIRISSIEPNLLKNEAIDFISKSKRFVPHFHIPLQSGSDKILKKMKRRYLTPLFEDRVLRIKKLIPNACIGVDVIVGFPGESNDDFIKTYNLLNNLPISYLHVFSYSERPNTEADTMINPVPNSLRNKRSKILRILSIKKRRNFYDSQIDKNQKVLFEGENKKGYIYGFSENYVKVRTAWNPSLINEIRDVKLDEIDNEGFVRCKIL